MALTADQVQKFYIGYYARPADPVGLTYWQTQDEAAALKGFSESAEFTSQFTGLSASQQVTKVYNNLLGRAPDTAGLLYWSGELTAGRETIGTLVLSMTKNALGKDVTTIEDRVSYSKSFTAALDTPAEINAYAGAAATQTARTALLKVVANSVGDHTALNAEVKNIDATVATIVAGGGAAPAQTFTLTTGNDFADVAGSFRNGGTIDTGFKFTSANETVTASTATMGNAGANIDSLSDATTTDADVLNVAVTGNTTMATIANIETINFNVAAGTAASTVANLVGVTGLKTITLSGSPAGAIDLTNAAAYTAIGATGVTTIDASKMTTGGITVSSATATTTAALTITGSDAADNITGGLGADKIVGGAGADTLAGGAGADDISGGAGNDFIQGGNDADTLNGDAGNDNIDGGAAADTINGGAGNDIIVTTAGNDTVTGGAGNDFIALGALTGGLAAGDAATVVAQLGAGADAAIFLAGTKATTAAGSNTVHLEASVADNGADVITGFAMGAAAAGGDILNVSKFLGKAVTNYVQIGSADGANNVTGSNVVVVTDGTLATAIAEAGGAGVVFGANAKTVVVEFQETNTGATDDNAVVRYITTDSNGAILSNDVVATLVGVVADGTNNIAALLAGNFA